ncbi:MobP3 family relaxase, partial [Sutterella wadsworthensis]|uniref:MobP3 family relaxase n=1 Tax=Sutterella wadsworthensis TaxID=40545 RepID=UPI003AF48EBC
MARLIQKTGFISRKSAGGYMKYIATREGVEVLTGTGPATEKQKEMVSKLLKDFPDVRDSFEYEDYKQAPTLHNASALISAALDSHMQNLQSENGYLKYIATRPGAEKNGAHGLFGREESVDLDEAMRDLTAHDGNVWTIIYSLHREDAERLGYNNAAAWQKLLISQQQKFAEAFHVSASGLHWYAAYHDADTHPHIHMMLWTDQKAILKRTDVVKLRSAMTNRIFQTELENLYIQKDAAYKDVTEAAREVMRELVDRMESVSAPPASIQQKLLDLANELASVSGKKQYGYLRKPLKDKVDEIVDELEKLPIVKQCYEQWLVLQNQVDSYY